jgi:hypothetical protein
MVAVPAVMPETRPLKDPTVATAGVLLLQVPPAVGSNRTVVAPAQMELTPLITAGTVYTVTVVVAEQPE